MLSRFRIFWDNLSSPGIQLRNLHKLLQTDSTRQPPDKISPRKGGSHDIASRDSFQTHLKLLADLVIADLADLPAFQSRRRDSFERVIRQAARSLNMRLPSKDVIQSRYPVG